jgi:ActR/RegA family two-component response regulator
MRATEGALRWSDREGSRFSDGVHEFGRHNRLRNVPVIARRERRERVAWAGVCCQCDRPDLTLPDVDALELLRQFNRASPDVESVVMTGRSSLRSGEAIRAGASHFSETPVDGDDLLAILHKALETLTLRTKYSQLPTSNLRVMSMTVEWAPCQLEKRRLSLRTSRRSFAHLMAAVVLVRDRTQRRSPRETDPEP